MFIKKFFIGQRADVSFWRNYEAQIDAFSIDAKGDRRSVFKAPTFVRFAVSKSDQWTYELVLRSADPKADPYFFPMKKGLVVGYEVRKEDVLFDFRVQSDLRLELVFPALEEQFDAAARFREIVGRLLYQTEHRVSYRECATIEDEIAARVVAKAPRDARRDAALVALGAELARLEKQENCVLAGVGRFSTLNPGKPTDEPRALAAEAILGIFRKSGFEYEFRVLDESAKVIYSKALDGGLHYHVDESRNSITWVDTRDGVACLNFALAGGEIAAVRRAVAACVIEAQRGMEIEQIAEEKSGWDKYYLGEDDLDEREQLQVKAFREGRVELNATGAARPIAAAESNAISGFAQGKAKDLCFVTRDSGIEVYRFRRDSNEQLGFEPAGALRPTDGAARCALPLQRDTRLAAVDGRDAARAMLLDAETGKVVNEWKAKSPLNDIGYFHGKAQPLGDAATFLAVGDRDIYAVDPRTKEGAVQHHNYKTDYGFKKVVAVDETRIAVSARNGDLRLYGSVGGKAAKNLIPAFAPAEAVSMDASRDGTLLLVAYPKHVLLLVTVQAGQSAFKTTFRKDSKPQPIVLTVAPAEMARHGLAELSFTAARFDEKADADESFIVASSNPFLVLWSIARVLRGQTASENVKRMEDTVIKGEFKYNENDLVAAFRDHLCIQPTKENK